MVSKVASYFITLAGQNQVRDEDLLTLTHLGILTASDLFFRIPSVEALEKYLAGKAFVNVGVMDHEKNVSLEQRSDFADVDEWLISAGAGNIRRLWEASKIVAQADLKIASESNADPSRKVTKLVAADMMRKAMDSGLEFSSDRAKPGPMTLALIANNFSPSGDLTYVDWECYICERDEIRAGLDDKERRKEHLRISKDMENHLMLEASGKVHPTRPSISQEIDLREVFELRTNTHATCCLVPVEIYGKYHSCLLRLLKQEVPHKMRGPTFAEIRMIDKNIHHSILTYVASGDGLFRDGLEFYATRDGLKEWEWEMAKPVDETTPDRGILRPLKTITSATQSAGSQHGSGGDRPRSRSPRRDPPLRKPDSKCDVCGKAKAQHPSGRFCQRPAKSGGGKSAGKKGGSKGEAPQAPNYMPNCFTRTPAIGGGRSEVVCMDFNNPNKGCFGRRCTRSHKCPKKLPDGRMCGGDHPQFDHKD